MVDFVATA